MPDSYFSIEGCGKENKMSSRPALTAVVEIMDFEYFVSSEKFHELQSFYDELVCEIHNSQRENYRRGFGVIRPEISIISDRIYVHSFLYLEKDVPELSSLIFNLFVDTCNMILAVALKHEMVVRGIGGIDSLVHTVLNSECATRLEKQDTLMLSDMLKVFTFEEIFPDGVDRVFIPPASLRVLHGMNFLHANTLLKEINAVGIYFPDCIRNYPAAELAIYSDLLIETHLDGRNIFVANWVSWAEKHSENFPLEEVQDSILRLSKEGGTDYTDYWKNFSGLSSSFSL